MLIGANTCGGGDCDSDFHTVCIISWIPDNCCNQSCVTFEPCIIHYRRWSEGSPPNYLDVTNWLPGASSYCYQTYKREGQIEIILRKFCCDGRLYCYYWSDKIPKPRADCDDNSTQTIKAPLFCQHMGNIQCIY